MTQDEMIEALVESQRIIKQMREALETAEKELDWYIDSCEEFSINTEDVKEGIEKALALYPPNPQPTSQDVGDDAPVGYVKEERDALNTLNADGNVYMVKKAYIQDDDAVKSGDKLYTKPQTTSQDVLDAERYRWLRISKNLQINLITYCFEQGLDDEIDKAMKESK